MAPLCLNCLAFLLSILGFKGIRILSYILGILAFDIVCIRRKIILNNLDIVYKNSLSKKQKKHIGRKSFINFISTALEFIAAKHLIPKAKFRFKNDKLAQQIVSQNLGVYSICMHYGNWEYLCHVNARKYRPVYVIVKDVLSGKAEQWIKNLRRVLGYKLVDRLSRQSASQQIFNAIDQKNIVGFIVDQKKLNGIMLPFFGKLAPTNTGLAKLYFRKPAPLVCANISRIKPGEFLVEYYEFSYVFDKSKSLSENISAMSLQINTLIEPIILKNPQEYYWLHNRWNQKI